MDDDDDDDESRPWWGQVLGATRRHSRMLSHMMTPKELTSSTWSMPSRSSSAPSSLVVAASGHSLFAFPKSNLPLVQDDLSLPQRSRQRVAADERYALAAQRIVRGEEISNARSISTKHSLIEPIQETQDVEVMAEAFVDDVGMIDRTIHEVRNHIRLDKLLTCDENKACGEREEVKRRKWEELRRARKREQMERNPQRKVAIMIENKRRYEEDGAFEEEVSSPTGSKNTCVPMQKVNFSGCKGVERVELVDVPVLRSRCQQLAEGATVDSLLVAQSVRERQEQSSSGSILGRTSSSAGISSTVLGSPCTRERIKWVKANRQLARDKRMLQKMSHMRAPLGQNALMQVGAAATRTYGTAIGADLVRPSDPDLDVDPVVLRRSIHHWSGGGSNVDVVSNTDDNLVQPTTKKNLKAVARQVMVASRWASQTRKRKTNLKARRLWGIVRGVIYFLLVCLRHKRLKWSAEVLKEVIQQIGEWARIKNGFKRLLSSVRVLQATFRTFVSAKKVRREIMCREWQKWEDDSLASYFKYYAKTLIHERERKLQAEQDALAATSASMKKRVRAAKAKQQMEATVPFPRGSIDWHAFRVPRREREAMINKYYMCVLRRHVRCKGTFLSTVQSVLRNQLELSRFLKEMGADESQTEDTVATFGFDQIEDVKVMPFWYLGQETALELISLAAQGLRHIEPFQEHPANKDQPMSEFSKLAQLRHEQQCSQSETCQQRRKNLRQGRRGSAVPVAELMNSSPASVGAGRIDRIVAQRTRPQNPNRGWQTETEEGESEEEDLDLDTVLSRLTPRLRRISAVAEKKTILANAHA